MGLIAEMRGLLAERLIGANEALEAAKKAGVTWVDGLGEKMALSAFSKKLTSGDLTIPGRARAIEYSPKGGNNGTFSLTDAGGEELAKVKCYREQPTG